jgi:hypothetical protein
MVRYPFQSLHFNFEPNYAATRSAGHSCRSFRDLLQCMSLVLAQPVSKNSFERGTLTECYALSKIRNLVDR